MSLAFLVALAVSGAQSPHSITIDTTRPFSASRTIRGIYKYVDGDRFFYNCGGDTCVDTLIRDDYLQKNVVALNGHWITIKVKRVQSCDSEQGDRTACMRSGGSAFRIVRWISPGG